mmetsp:Transcript_23217/g.33749  ORF Transcript_23217/g.33749 Transcript_23217/m.33749 type:complete len:364 (-) Transcript_23217:75-1166(-)|eukprot:CAMPEP_0113947500 /NCGR_PEP_ID=MMETSP1339-20121228/65175_1 /TAXON_ID=94617 /ORGANISM="Fibrocapsa japonica" /LENGTH=363 /DNA_ID=CAMNT_0000954141 /DNA_START=20 /DNA_END=1111 /DNA_ORIENTATION=+ /assembly_acc=CAM_ASM_000762
MRLLSHLLLPAVSSLALSASNNSPLYVGNSKNVISNIPSNSISDAFTVHRSFEEIVDKYDGFILDQFGVLHNGVHALEGAVDCLEHLFKKNKKLIILSNTSAPAHKAIEKLPKFGFPSEFFLGAVTSGEEASRYIRGTYGNNPITSSKALFFTWDAFKPNNPRLTAPPQSFLDQCGNVEIASSIDTTDFLLIHGSEVWCRGTESADQSTSLGSFIETGDLDAIDPILKDCLERDLPLVCANPDCNVVTPTGGTAYMPGRIAQRYKEMGGKCRVFGKPDVEHFEACVEKLGMDKSQVAHVGDSLHHDIAGASAASIPNVFVASGIHANKLGIQYGEMPEQAVLESLFEEEGLILPTHVVPAFTL